MNRRHTERYVSVAHPSGCREVVVGCKSSEFIACHQIPYNGRLAGVVADNIPPAATFALIIHRK